MNKIFKIISIYFLVFSCFFYEVNSQEINPELNKIESEKNDQALFYGFATLQVLNKINAKSSILDIKIGDKAVFSTIKIIPHKCWKASLDQKPENKILLEVFETKSEDFSSRKMVEKRIFYGWIFSSSPSISGLQHPIYDITAINCKK